jgi:aspartate aminotransferase-like enzyme
VSAPYGQTFAIDEVKKAISPQTKLVLMQATETSTGVRHEVGAVGALLRGTETLLVV